MSGPRSPQHQTISCLNSHPGGQVDLPGGRQLYVARRTFVVQEHDENKTRGAGPSDPAAAAAADVPPPPLPLPPPPLPAGGDHRRRGGAWGSGAAAHVDGHLDSFVIGCFGHIKIDRKRGSLNAHCSCLGGANAPGGRDHRTLTMPECRANRVGTKAPLGLLVLWLRKGCECSDRNAHGTLAKHLGDDLAGRTEAREWLNSQHGLRPLLEFEAACLGCAVGMVREPARI